MTAAPAFSCHVYVCCAQANSGPGRYLGRFDDMLSDLPIHGRPRNYHGGKICYLPGAGRSASDNGTR